MIAVRIEHASWSERAVVMRLPFQFGNTEVRETAEAYCEVQAVIDGRCVSGQSAQLMVPRWFDKRTDLSNADTIDELRASVAAAVGAAPGMTGSAVSIARDLRGAVSGAMPPGTPDLAAGFGPALLEMALIDAICRAAALPFWHAAREDLFGLAANRPPDLSKEALEAALNRISPPTSVRLRHTIGFDAPLTRAEVGRNSPSDGLPVSVEEVIADTGITAFKIKMKGAPEADLARLRAIASVLSGCADFSVTLDANEQYGGEAFTALLSGLDGDPELARLRAATRFFEQPFAREEALSTLGPVDFGVPLIIDESDDTEDAFPRALALGWSGTSIKSCKGVLRALYNMARAEAAGALLSGEDLTCQPGLCWQQDTAMAAALGVRDIERNGHHFAGGMQGAPEDEIARLLKAHPEMYTQVRGRPTLRIAQGQVAVTSLGKAGFGRAGNGMGPDDT